MPEDFEIPAQHLVHLAWKDARLKPTSPNDKEFSTPADVDRLFNESIPAFFEQTGRRAITVYFHGGLVDAQTIQFHNLKKEGFQYRDSNRPLFDTLHARSYPVFFVWETGLLESLKSLGDDYGDAFRANPLAATLQLLKHVGGSFLFKKFSSKLLNLVSKRAGLTGLGADEPEDLTIPDDAWENAVDRAAVDDDPAALNRLAEDSLRLDPNLNEDVEYPEPDLEAEHDAELYAVFDQDAELKRYLRDFTEEALVHDEAAGLAGDDRSLEDDAYLSEAMIDTLKGDYVEFIENQGAGLDAVDLLEVPIEELFPATMKSLVEIFKRILVRVYYRKHHSIIPTIVEELVQVTPIDEIAVKVWGQMKHNAAEAYAVSADPAEPHGGRYFVEKLLAFLDQPENAGVQVNLVGHSAGSIHVSHFVHATAELLDRFPGLAGFKFKNIIFWAPGVDYRTFRRIVANQALVDRLRIFTMFDTYEQKDWVLGPLYPASLLYLVSGIAEADRFKDTPLLGLARHLDRKQYEKNNDRLRKGMHKAFIKNDDHEKYKQELDDVQAVHDFIAALEAAEAHPVVWGVTGDGAPAGQQTRAEKHGAFDNDAPTLASLDLLLQP